jgi:hypothetical protein
MKIMRCSQPAKLIQIWPILGRKMFANFGQSASRIAVQSFFKKQKIG